MRPAVPQSEALLIRDTDPVLLAFVNGRPKWTGCESQIAADVRYCWPNDARRLADSTCTSFARCCILSSPETPCPMWSYLCETNAPDGESSFQTPEALARRSRFSIWNIYLALFFHCSVLMPTDSRGSRAENGTAWAPDVFRHRHALAFVYKPRRLAKRTCLILQQSSSHPN